MGINGLMNGLGAKNILSEKIVNKLQHVISGVILLFFGYLWCILEKMNSKDLIIKSDLVKNIVNLKTHRSISKPDFTLFVTILNDKPNLFVVCVIFLIVPLLFFIYSLFIAARAIRNLSVEEIVNSWFMIFFINGLNFYPDFIGQIVCQTIFYENFGLWLYLLQKQLYLSSILVIIVVY